MEKPGGGKTLCQTARSVQKRDSFTMSFGETAGLTGEDTPSVGLRQLRALIARVPRPLRFLSVGALGLATDIVLFTILLWLGLGPLVAGFLALVAATVLTWRLNRAFTFESSGRHQGEEAVRYALVTAVAQGTSYGVFALLVTTLLAALPQAAIIGGAAAGALISYNGQRLFAFAPRQPAPSPVQS
jgi:putative flippase GtrA